MREVDAGGLATVRLFLQADEGEYAQDWERSGLFGVVKTKDLAMLTEILENGNGLEPQWINSAFLQAARSGLIQVMELLLADGADIDYKYGDYDFTPLLAVVLNRDIAGMEFLLDRGADPNKNGADDNITPLMMPFQRYSQHLSGDEEKIEVVRFLLQHGADINGEDRDGRTVLNYARNSGMRESVRFIKDAGAEIPFTEESFRYLVKENDSRNLQSFLEQGIDPDLEGFDYYEENMTGLIWAARRGYQEVCRVLLEAGVEVGQNVLDVIETNSFAWNSGQREEVRKLIWRYIGQSG